MMLESGRIGRITRIGPHRRPWRSLSVFALVIAPRPLATGRPVARLAPVIVIEDLVEELERLHRRAQLVGERAVDHDEDHPHRHRTGSPTRGASRAGRPTSRVRTSVSESSSSRCQFHLRVRCRRPWSASGASATRRRPTREANPDAIGGRRYPHGAVGRLRFGGRDRGRRRVGVPDLVNAACRCRASQGSALRQDDRLPGGVAAGDDATRRLIGGRSNHSAGNYRVYTDIMPVYAGDRASGAGSCARTPRPARGGRRPDHGASASPTGLAGLRRRRGVARFFQGAREALPLQRRPDRGGGAAALRRRSSGQRNAS